MLDLDSINDIKDIIKHDDGTFTVVHSAYKSKSGARLVEASWTQVPHYNKKGKLLDNETYKKQTIAKYGKQYFAQTEECEFLGSASTLISTEALKLLRWEEPKSLDKLFTGIKIYKEVQKGHSYIMSVDTAKDGIDSFSLHITDITQFPFEQVAAAKLDVDYLIMPEHLDTLGLYYNEAYIVIENNEGSGQSIADMLYMVYEYPNMYRDRDTNDKKYKKFYGFRQTKKTRPTILNMMKIFIEEGKLLIHDKDTIEEFFNFIKNDNITLKFAAEEGYHDDMVMSLSMLFAPFMHIKAFDDLELFLGSLRIVIGDDGTGAHTADFMSLLDIGGFDSGEEEVVDMSQQEKLQRIENITNEDEQFEAIRQLNRGL